MYLCCSFSKNIQQTWLFSFCVWLLKINLHMIGFNFDYLCSVQFGSLHEQYTFCTVFIGFYEFALENEGKWNLSNGKFILKYIEFYSNFWECYYFLTTSVSHKRKMKLRFNRKHNPRIVNTLFHLILSLLSYSYMHLHLVYLSYLRR